jgi:DNA-binding IscR family transcriptional regulator
MTIVKVFFYVRDNPLTTSNEIAAALNYSPSWVRVLLWTLKKEGLVVANGVGMNNMYEVVQ